MAVYIELEEKSLVEQLDKLIQVNLTHLQFGPLLFEVCLALLRPSIPSGRKMGNRGRESDTHSIKQHAGIGNISC
jgi:hypothetical protein